MWPVINKEGTFNFPNKLKDIKYIFVTGREIRSGLTKPIHYNVHLNIMVLGFAYETVIVKHLVNKRLFKMLLKSC